MHDFLDNLANHQYQKIHSKNAKRPGNPEQKEKIQKFLKSLLKND